MLESDRAKKMAGKIQIVAHEGIDKDFLTQIRAWANEVLERPKHQFQLPDLCITVWKTMEDLQNFYRKEKEALGVMTGEEMDFMATHEAWRGYPRVHVCQEKLIRISSAVVQGVIHHEMGHALHHGTPEFYTFRFSSSLQEAGLSCGLDLPLLQQCVYFVSVAIKDRQVVEWLTKIGLGFSQHALLGHLVSNTEEEHRIWEVVRGHSALRKIAFAAFLKTLLPIEAMISVGIKEARTLENEWNKAYGWLSEGEREGLFRLARCIMNLDRETFQEQLEQATLRLISERDL